MAQLQQQLRVIETALSDAQGQVEEVLEQKVAALMRQSTAETAKAKADACIEHLMTDLAKLRDRLDQVSLNTSSGVCTYKKGPITTMLVFQQAASQRWMHPFRFLLPCKMKRVLVVIEASATQLFCCYPMGAPFVEDKALSCTKSLYPDFRTQSIFRALRHQYTFNVINIINHTFEFPGTIFTFHS